MCTEHCWSITEISWKSGNQFLKLYPVKIILEITVNSSKQGFLSNLVSVAFLISSCVPAFYPTLFIFPSPPFRSHSHSDSCITLQLLFGCQIFYSFTDSNPIQTKSQNAQPRRLPFSMTPITITIYP